MQIELKGFTLTSNDTQLCVEGPDDEASKNIGRAFLNLLKTPDGYALLERYMEARTELIDVLCVPTIEQDNPSLDNLIEWLKDNPDWIASVEEALGPHGYEKLNDN
ncbi:MAG: hypothetical protein RRC34_08680 [Lentisphaeria bacterium]|nr:hypothetical protein [Lentisphaeria bacterium]